MEAIQRTADTRRGRTASPIQLDVVVKSAMRQPRVEVDEGSRGTCRVLIAKSADTLLLSPPHKGRYGIFSAHPPLNAFASHPHPAATRSHRSSAHADPIP